MPTDDTPRQKKHASWAASCDWIAERSKKSAWTTSTSFGCTTPEALRLMTSTRTTRGSARHSSGTPAPPMPVAPVMMTERLMAPSGGLRGRVRRSGRFDALPPALARLRLRERQPLAHARRRQRHRLRLRQREDAVEGLVPDVHREVEG